MDALHLAAAVEILTGDASLTAICCWCLAERDPHFRVPSRRVGGDCSFCAYNGPDTHCASLKPESFALNRPISIDVAGAPVLTDGRRYVTMDDDDSMTPISWVCVGADGKRHGGAYGSHASASATIIEFPAHFAGCRIVPAYSVTRPVAYGDYSGPYELIPLASDWTLAATHGVL